MALIGNMESFVIFSKLPSILGSSSDEEKAQLGIGPHRLSVDDQQGMMQDQGTGAGSEESLGQVSFLSEQFSLLPCSASRLIVWEHCFKSLSQPHEFEIWFSMSEGGRAYLRGIFKLLCRIFKKCRKLALLLGEILILMTYCVLWIKVKRFFS